MKLLIVQIFPQSHSPPVSLSLSLSLSRVHILSTVFPSLPRYVHIVVATSMVSDEMDGACSANGISKKCVKKLCSENGERVLCLEDHIYRWGNAEMNSEETLVCDSKYWIELAEDTSLRRVDSCA